MEQKEIQFWQTFLNDGPQAWREAEKIPIPISIPPKARAVIDSICKRGMEAGDETTFDDIAGDIFDMIINYGIHSIANTVYQQQNASNQGEDEGNAS
jgi:hypothetical protein